MIDAEQALAFSLAAFVLIAIPGPSVVFVIGRALSYGRGVALASVVGNTLGLLTVLVLVAVGLGALVAESVVVFTALKLVGAAYLVFLGIQAIRHRSGFQDADPDLPRTLDARLAVRQGYVVGVTNPKGFMIFAALLPQFVDRASGDVPLQMLLLGLIAVLIGLLSDSVWAVGASEVRSWFTGSPRRGEAVATLGGLSMVGLGAALAVSDHR